MWHAGSRLLKGTAQTLLSKQTIIEKETGEFHSLYEVGLVKLFVQYK